MVHHEGKVFALVLYVVAGNDGRGVHVFSAVVPTIPLQAVLCYIGHELLAIAVVGKEGEVAGILLGRASRVVQKVFFHICVEDLSVTLGIFLE